MRHSTAHSRVPTSNKHGSMPRSQYSGAKSTFSDQPPPTFGCQAQSCPCSTKTPRVAPASLSTQRGPYQPDASSIASRRYVNVHDDEISSDEDKENVPPPSYVRRTQSSAPLKEAQRLPNHNLTSRKARGTRQHLGETSRCDTAQTSFMAAPQPQHWRDTSTKGTKRTYASREEARLKRDQLPPSCVCQTEDSDDSDDFAQALEVVVEGISGGSKGRVADLCHALHPPGYEVAEKGTSAKYFSTEISHKDLEERLHARGQANDELEERNGQLIDELARLKAANEDLESENETLDDDNALLGSQLDKSRFQESQLRAQLEAITRSRQGAPTSRKRAETRGKHPGPSENRRVHWD